MKNGWSGGQYSLFRFCFGIYLFIHFVALIPWAPEIFSNEGVLSDGALSPLLYLFPNVLILADSPLFVQSLLTLSSCASLIFALGWRDKVAAFFMWYVLACLFGRNPLTLNPSLPFVGWMLLAHMILPGAPYGSVAARGRLDPNGGWQFQPRLFLVAWIVMSVAYSYSGIYKLASPSWVDGSALAEVLANPLARPTLIREILLGLPNFVLQLLTWAALLLELLFAPIALFTRARLPLWTAMTLMHLGLLVLINFADLSLAMILLHFFTFDPNWIQPQAKDSGQIVFFDGNCALCHGWVRFLLAEDRLNRFSFSALQGETLKNKISEAELKKLPDSIILLTPDGVLLSRSSAIVEILARLGGLWRVVGIMIHLFPKSFRDFAYDIVARFRKRVFGTKSELCPIVPPEIRVRFLP